MGYEDIRRDEARLMKRFEELANKAYAQNIYLFTNFLSLAEQDLFYQCKPDRFPSGYTVFGGVDQAERVMIRFGNKEELGYEQQFPIHCIQISPAARKFAEELTHRDYLGALMNLGIERSTMGDILICDKDAYLFCEETISSYVMENITRIRHTDVVCMKLEELPEILRKEPVVEEFTVASQRIDAVVSRLYNIARSTAAELLASGKVWVNGRMVMKSTMLLHSNDVVSVRGYGKFIYYGETRQTRKGRLSVSAGVYK